ncbi:hypothetical protein [Neobacillus drentensis]|uniref:hypothetical protein n=1 Tax=Neobacillus drentensis TaxID=220684 RepID=UPI00286AE90A|nr:hypothetical protein [Neobacillus drentensis]
MLWRLNEFWDWFWYYRKGKIKYRFWDEGNTFSASASTGEISVWNCYGPTRAAAKEMALYRLKQAMEREPKEQELVVESEHIAIYREK